jgi:Family of unknown function (DUF5677)
MANDYGERFFEIGISVAEKFAARMGELTKSEALFSHLRDRGFTASDQNAFDYSMITFFFFCKTYKTYQAIRMLCRGGFVEDALVLGRTIFEIYLQSEWMSQYPQGRAVDFMNYESVKRYDSYLKLKKCDPEFAALLEKHPEAIANLEAMYARYADQFSKKDQRGNRRIADNWWQRSIAWLASKKPELQKDYVQTYALQSGIVHSSPTCVNEYLRWSEAAEAGWQMNCHPDHSKESHFNLVAIDSTRWLLGFSRF